MTKGQARIPEEHPSFQSTCLRSSSTSFEIAAIAISSTIYFSKLKVCEQDDDETIENDATVDGVVGIVVNITIVHTIR